VWTSRSHKWLMPMSASTASSLSMLLLQYQSCCVCVSTCLWSNRVQCWQQAIDWKVFLDCQIDPGVRLAVTSPYPAAHNVRLLHYWCAACLQVDFQFKCMGKAGLLPGCCQSWDIPHQLPLNICNACSTRQALLVH
jgi:hypothetical protein